VEEVPELVVEALLAEVQDVGTKTNSLPLR
jgi:hypothetical protein